MKDILEETKQRQAVYVAEVTVAHKKTNNVWYSMWNTVENLQSCALVMESNLTVHLFLVPEQDILSGYG